MPTPTLSHARSNNYCQLSQQLDTLSRDKQTSQQRKIISFDRQNSSRERSGIRKQTSIGGNNENVHSSIEFAQLHVNQIPKSSRIITNKIPPKMAKQQSLQNHQSNRLSQERNLQHMLTKNDSIDLHKLHSDNIRRKFDFEEYVVRIVRENSVTVEQLELIHSEIQHSTKNASAFYHYMNLNNWLSLRSWMSTSSNSSSSAYINRLIVTIISEVINHAINDSKRSKLGQNSKEERKHFEPFSQDQQIHRRTPLQNITSSVNNVNINGQESTFTRHLNGRNEQKTNSHKVPIPGASCLLQMTKSNSLNNIQNISIRALGQNVFNEDYYEDKIYFTKEQLVSLIKSQLLVDVIKMFCTSLKFDCEQAAFANNRDRFALCKILFQICDTILYYYKKQQLYDDQAMKYLKNGIFDAMLQLFKNSDLRTINPHEQKYISRCLEFCSTHKDGIRLIYTQRYTVFTILQQFFNENIDEEQVLYASATVLLDLTANEQCLEQVATLIKDFSMFDFIIAKAKNLIQRNPSDTHYQKLRDLFIGILLNLSCNVENSELIKYMIVQQKIIPVLMQILIDYRHDWPTNGAALAILSYSHLALQDMDAYSEIDSSNLKKILEDFINRCQSKEAKKNMYEALTIIEVVNKKMRSMGEIMRVQVYAACA